MLHSSDFDFSFSGLKTAVLYATRDKTLTDTDKQALARDFEDAVVEVLTKKLIKAIKEYAVNSVVLGGGVSANKNLRASVSCLNSSTLFPNLDIHLPEPDLSTDNSIMIALAGHSKSIQALTAETFIQEVHADGNKSLGYNQT